MAFAGFNGIFAYASSQSQVVPALPSLASVDFTDGLPHGWQIMGPNSAASTARAAAVTFDANGCTIISDHIYSDPFATSQTAPVGIAVPVYDTSFDVYITMDSFTNYAQVPSGFWSVQLGLYWGGADITAAQAKGLIVYKKAGTPYWYAEKRHKLPNQVGAEQTSDPTTVQSAETPAWTNLYLRLKWNELTGYQTYWSDDIDGSGWTEIGGGTVATGAVDPHASATELDADSSASSPGLAQKFLCICTGQSQSSTTTHPTVRVTGLTRL